MKTNRILKALAALTVLVLFHFSLVRLGEYRKASAVAESEARAAHSAERVLGIHPARYTLPGGLAL